MSYELKPINWLNIAIACGMLLFCLAFWWAMVKLFEAFYK